ncbi:MAG: arylsulfatase [Vallitalea sp.]|jgi:arylsulfatase A-like enzyme|nr:arylsulfatase [Vallitalea sp.]
MNTKQPNIILILTDQWRGDCIGALNNDIIQTPFLDEMTVDSVVFERAYSPSPVCVPGRACLITGKKPSSTGFFGNDFSVEWNYKNTLMEVLRDNGYQTINVGKNHFEPQRKALGFEINKLYETQNAYDEFKLPSDYHLWLEKETGGKVKDTAKMHENNGRVVFPWNAESRLHPTEWTLQESLDQIERKDPTRPFYLQMSFHRPHPPLDPPSFYYEMYRDVEFPETPIGDWAPEFEKTSATTNPFEGRIEGKALDMARKAYYGSISHIDAQIGKLLIWLKRRGILNDTIIIFTSDHGEMLGDHNMFRKGAAFEGSAKIPFIVRLPKNEEYKINSRTKVPVNLSDIMPTVLDLAGINIPEEVEGDSLKPILMGENLPDRKYVHGENYRIGLNRGWNYIVNEQYKYVWDSYSGLELFFDLDNDPKEIKNLMNEEKYGNIISQFKAYLIEELSKRPTDGLVKDNELVKGKLLPPYRKL